MPLRYLLDTNTCIRAMRANALSPLAQRFQRFQRELATSTIVVGELRFGAENSARVAHNHSEIDNFLGRLEAVLDFDHSAAEEYGRVRFALKNAPIGPLDTLIAAHARAAGLTIVTNNIREFSRVPGVAVEDWLVP
jgi:tRNA(fMet)-specific endonuclease VapC